MKREWIWAGPMDGDPPYSVGLKGVGFVLWFHTKESAERATDALNALEDYLKKGNRKEVVQR